MSQCTHRYKAFERLYLVYKVTRGRLTSRKAAKGGWKACVMIFTSSHLCVESLQTTCSSPSITLLQLKSFFINTAALRETQRPWAAEQLLLASPKITYYLRRRGAAAVPLAAAFSSPVCTPPPPYFLCQSLSNIRTHRSLWSLSAIFFVTPYGDDVIFSTLLCLCRQFYGTSNHGLLL